jgi:hypothetical protein
MLSTVTLSPGRNCEAAREVGDLGLMTELAAQNATG